MGNNELKPILKISDIAVYMGVSISTLDRMQADGLLIQPDYHFGRRGIRAWIRENFLEWLNTTQHNPKKLY